MHCNGISYRQFLPRMGLCRVEYSAPFSLMHINKLQNCWSDIQVLSYTGSDCLSSLAYTDDSVILSNNIICQENASKSLQHFAVECFLSKNQNANTTQLLQMKLNIILLLKCLPF